MKRGVTNNREWFYIGLPANLVAIVTFMLTVRLGGLVIGATISLTLLPTVLFGMFSVSGLWLYVTKPRRIRSSLRPAVYK